MKLMMKKWLVFLLLPLSLSATPLTITLEHAVTEEELAWGLMGRRALPDNHGMTFNYPSSERAGCWMFNCFINLSIAFLDEHHKITEIHELTAHPEWMDPNRPVTQLSDLRLYPPGDPIRLLFQKETIYSKEKVSYALEMRQGWFTDYRVQVGDYIFWNINQPEGQVWRSRTSPE
jgi:uncharacterized membrane protein (UPF0127 family)